MGKYYHDRERQAYFVSEFAWVKDAEQADKALKTGKMDVSAWQIYVGGLMRTAGCFEGPEGKECEDMFNERLEVLKDREARNELIQEKDKPVFDLPEGIGSAGDTAPMDYPWIEKGSTPPPKPTKAPDEAVRESEGNIEARPNADSTLRDTERPAKDIKSHDTVPLDSDENDLDW